MSFPLFFRLFVILTLADEGTEDRQGRVVGHEQRSIGVVQALADVLHDGSLGMELYADGTRLVGALNALYHVNARHGGRRGDAQGRSLGAEQGLVVPRGAAGERRRAKVAGHQRAVGQRDIVRRVVAVGFSFGLLAAVLIVIGQTLCGEPRGYVLNDGGSRHHAQQLRSINPGPAPYSSLLLGSF